VTGVVLGVTGDMQATVLLLFAPNDAKLMCGLLGVEAESALGVSALMEVGNIVGSSYINALSAMTGLALEPTPPGTATDMLAAIVETVLAERASTGDVALLLDSDLVVEGEDCSVSFLLVPDQGGVELLLARLGL
jgi:chemotaxis protein CheC